MYVHDRGPVLASLLVLILDEVERRGHMDLVLRTGLALDDKECLHHASQGNRRARPPSEGCEIDLNANSVEKSGNRRSHSATCGSR